MHPTKTGEIFQPFGHKWIADHDFILNGLQVHTGDDVYKKFFSLDGHNGLDYIAAFGDPIYAIKDGWIVEQISKPTGYGIRLSERIEDCGKFYIVVYGHLQRLANNMEVPWNPLNKTYPVKEGDIVGYADSTGFSSGNHLHLGAYETDANGGYLYPLNGFGGAVDPLPLIANNMSNAQFVKKAGSFEFGFYLPALSEDALKDKALNLGLNILKPDGTIDFSKAKEINL